MKLKKNGTDTLEALPDIQVQGISPNGFWMLIKGREYFLDFISYPWFKEASVDQIFNVTLLSDSHLLWNELDIDLDTSILESPEKYPLISQPS